MQFLHCVFSNVSSNRFPERIHSHTGFICYLYCGETNVQMQNSAILIFLPKIFLVRAGQGKIFWLNRCSGRSDCSSALTQSSIVRCPGSYIDWPTIVLKVRTGNAIFWIKDMGVLWDVGTSDCKCRTPNDAIWILFIRSIISKLRYSYFYRTERGAFVGRLQFAPYV